MSGVEPATSLVRVEIDGRTVDCEPGTTVLHAAAELGVEIPTLCHWEGLPPQTSCYLCVVEIEGQHNLQPSCSTRITEGMIVRTESRVVADARKMCLELLFSDHAGSCVGTCTTACPANLDIAGFLDELDAGDDDRALTIIRESLALPAVLGRVCHGFCESACTRRKVDESISIRQLHGFIAERDMARPEPSLPEQQPPSGHRVAIVGAGPAGLSAAHYLLQLGHACDVFDAQERPGGLLRYGMSDELLDKAVLDAEVGIIEKMGARFRGGWRLGVDGSLDDLRRDYGAVVLALGAAIDWDQDARKVDVDFVRQLGLGAGPRGVRIVGQTGRTTIDGVFAAGEIVSGPSNTVRAVAAGRHASVAVDQWLAARPVDGPHKPLFFRSRMTEGEEKAFLDRPVGPRAGELSATRICDVTPARTEAARCMDCTCIASRDCALRIYAARYKANTQKYRGERRILAPDRTHPLVDYEPGKCILCGLCLVVAETSDVDEPGLTFAGRGFTTQIAAPFGDDFAEAIGDSALECARVCPTGAIRKKRPGRGTPG